jgi:hypothetical protein
MDRLNLEEGTDMLSRNVAKQLQTNKAHHATQMNEALIALHYVQSGVLF